MDPHRVARLRSRQARPAPYCTRVPGVPPGGAQSWHGGVSGHSTSFQPLQLEQYQAQVMAYRLLARNQPLPPQLSKFVTGKRTPEGLTSHQSQFHASPSPSPAPIIPGYKVNSAAIFPDFSHEMTPDFAKKKCKYFLATLMQLASDQPVSVARSRSVRALIQDLVDGSVQPEVFTTNLLKVLNVCPQPALVPFLKKSLPYLQQSLADREFTIEGLIPPSQTMVNPQVRTRVRYAAHLTAQGMVRHPTQTKVGHPAQTIGSHPAQTMVGHPAHTMVVHPAQTMVGQGHPAQTMVGHHAQTMIGHHAQTMVGHPAQTMVGHPAQTMVGHLAQTMVGHTAQTMVGHRVQTLVGHPAQTMVRHHAQTMVRHQAQTMVRHQAQTMVRHQAQTMVRHQAQTMVRHQAQTMVRHQAQTIVRHQAQTMVRHQAQTIVRHPVRPQLRTGVRYVAYLSAQTKIREPVKPPNQTVVRHLESQTPPKPVSQWLAKKFKSLPSPSTVPTSLTKVPAKPTAKTLEDFIKKQIVEKERQLECPVCLEVAAPPILMCSELHLICSDCRPRIKNCPVCRKDFQNDSKRHRFAEQMAQEIEDLRKELENARS